MDLWVFSSTTVWKHQFFSAQPSLWSNSHIYIWLLEKNIALTIPLFDYTGCNILLDLCSDRVFSTQSRFVIAFLPRSKHLLISWLQSPSEVILEPKKIKSVTVSTFSTSICHEVTGPDATIFIFWMLSFKPAFSLSFFTFTQRHFSSSSLSAIRVVSSAYWGYWYFSQQSWFQFVLHPAQRFSWHFIKRCGRAKHCVQ